MGESTTAASSKSSGLKLNLGSGQNPHPAYVNVDKFGTPDVLCDLEKFPWPWNDNAVEEIVLFHVLEHLGESIDTFMGIMKEMYRVCRHSALIHIIVPHPRSDDFLNDPTHVRPITPEVLGLFSKRMNRHWKETRAANSPLGLYLDIDFEVVGVEFDLLPPWKNQMHSGATSREQIMSMMRYQNNVVKQTRILMKAIKDPAGITDQPYFRI